MHKVIRYEKREDWKRILWVQESKYGFPEWVIKYKVDAIKNEYMDNIIELFRLNKVKEIISNVWWELWQDSPWYTMFNN